MAVEVEQYTDQLIEALEKAQQERENWRTSFDNERFRADKLAATLSNEIEQSANVRGQLLIAHKTLLNQQAKIAELESRNVKLPERYACELLVGNAPDLNGDILDRDAVIDALTAAGIKWEAE
jgi:predicted transcriptional regulator